MIDPVHPDYTNTPASPQRPRFGYTPADLAAPPCVTVVTPFYNTGSIFYETARSVLQQSFQQWEWLIINDGSTDPESLAILDNYRQCDPRIRVIDHTGNRGLSAARNTGFHVAQTPYVVQLDSDDLLEPTTIEKWCWFLQSHPHIAFVNGYTVGFGAQEYMWQKGFHNGSAFLENNLVDATSAIRKAVHQAVGGYDEVLRTGFEDWDFWLRCASHGYWGETIPEYLDWYRRRPRHDDRWPDFDGGERQQEYRTRLREKYASLWEEGFPCISFPWHEPSATVPETLLYDNRLQKKKPRLLLIGPGLEIAGNEKFTLAALEQLAQRGWEITIAATQENHSGLPRFARFTPDIFILRHFLPLVDYPRFLHYLIRSRQSDVVMISHSELGYLLLPYLRASCPEVPFVDFCHIADERWKNGDYSRMPVEYQELLDLNLVSSEHLRRWMIKEGANPERISVCYTNIDTEMAEKLVVFLQEAMRLHAIQPGPVPSLALGRVCAVQTRVIQEQRGYIEELKKDKAQMEEQWKTWQQRAQECEKLIQDQKSWIGELEKGRAWLEEQWAAWQQRAEEREKLVQEQQSWIRELEKGRAWLEEQWANWKRIAEERERIVQEQEDLIQAWQNSVWGWVGVRSGILRRPSVTDGN